MTNKAIDTKLLPAQPLTSVAAGCLFSASSRKDSRFLAVVAFASFFLFHRPLAAGAEYSAVEKAPERKATSLTGSASDDVMTLDSLPPSRTLKGQAELLDSPAQAAQLFEEGMAAIEKKQYASAADLLKQAGAHYGPGAGKNLAECQYFEAGCRLMTGENVEATNLYRSAWHLFERYDPDSPYKETAIEQLCKLTYSKLRADKLQKLEAVAVRRAQIIIDQTVTLEGHAEKNQLGGLAEIDKNMVPGLIHRAFLQMTCLETAELGSNSTNAHYRWLPMLAYSKPAAIGVAAGFTEPFVKIKVNGRIYRIAVSLPNLRPGLRRILLVTNKEKVCAIDESTGEIWQLQMKREKNGNVNSFSWKKFTHKKH